MDGGSLSTQTLTMRNGGSLSATKIPDIASKLPRGTRVAIVSFESPHGNLSVYIMDEIAGSLVGSMEVANRNSLEYVYKELNLQMSGDVSDESAQSIGKFLGAQYVITGQFLDTGGRYSYRLNSINVETALHEISTRLDVRNDQRFQDLYAALQKSAPVVRTAGYGAGSAPAPKTAGTFLDRGIMFASRGEYDMAIADFADALNLDLDMDMASTWMLRGRALYASVSNQALRLNPNDALVYNNRAFLYSFPPHAAQSKSLRVSDTVVSAVTVRRRV